MKIEWDINSKFIDEQDLGIDIFPSSNIHTVEFSLECYIDICPQCKYLRSETKRHSPSENSISMEQQSKELFAGIMQPGALQIREIWDTHLWMIPPEVKDSISQNHATFLYD